MTGFTTNTYMKHWTLLAFAAIALATAHQPLHGNDSMITRATELMAALGIAAGSDQAISQTNTSVLSSEKFLRLADFSVKHRRRTEKGNTVLQEFELLDDSGNSRFSGRVITATTPRDARAKLFEELVRNSMPIDLLKRTYQSVTNEVGELCLRKMRFDKSTNAFVTDTSEMIFARSNVAVCLYSAEPGADIEPVAKAVDNILLGAGKP